MTSPMPIYVRLFRVQEVFGLHPDTVRNWQKAGRIEIIKRGRMAFVRAEDMIKTIEGLGD